MTACGDVNISSGCSTLGVDVGDLGVVAGAEGD